MVTAVGSSSFEHTLCWPRGNSHDLTEAAELLWVSCPGTGWGPETCVCMAFKYGEVLGAPRRLPPCCSSGLRSDAEGFMELMGKLEARIPQPAQNPSWAQACAHHGPRHLRRPWFLVYRLVVPRQRLHYSPRQHKAGTRHTDSPFHRVCGVRSTVPNWEPPLLLLRVLGFPMEVSVHVTVPQATLPLSLATDKRLRETRCGMYNCQTK